MAFAAHLARTKSASTVTTYLAAVRFHHLAKGFDAANIHSPQISLVLRGIRRRCQRRRTRSGISFSLLNNILSHLKHVYPANKHDRKMLLAAIALAFYGLFRASEIAAPTTRSSTPTRTLALQDINFRPDHSMVITIKASKTDQSHLGSKILIGCSGSRFCPVQLMEDYCAACHHLQPHDPLFHYSNRSYLTSSRITEVLRECIRAVGKDPSSYSSHSLRIGGATAAAAAGVKPSLIQEMGRWRSRCFTRYTRVPNSRLQQVASQIVATSTTAPQP